MKVKNKQPEGERWRSGWCHRGKKLSAVVAAARLVHGCSLFTQGRRVTAWTLPANKAAYQSSALTNEPPGKNRPEDKQAGSTR